MLKTIFGLMLVAGLLDAQAVRGNAGFSKKKMANADDNYEPASLGFNLNFFGQSYQSTYVSNNGNVTFGGPYLGPDGNAAWVPLPLRSLTGVAMIAPFFADVDTTRSNAVTYGSDTVNGRPAFGVNYFSVGYFEAKADKLNSFQVVLIERGDTGPGNFDIEFNYGGIQWDIGESTTSGRAYASVGYTNGIGGQANSSFELPGSLSNGAFLDGGAYALIRQSRNSGGVAGRLVFEVRNGNVNSTTLVLQPDKTILNCPDITLISRGTGYTNPRFTSPPEFTYGLTENGQPRQITQAFSTMVPGAPSGTYDFTVKYRGIAETSATGTKTTSDVVLTVSTVLPGSDGIISASDAKTIRNCGVAADCGTLPKDGRVGFSLSGKASATGGIPPYVFSAPNGVPPGLSFAKDGTISGTPTNAGTFTYSVKVDDQSVSPVQFGLATCAINVLGPSTPLTGTCSTPAGTAGSAYQGAIVASGGAGQYVFSLTSGALAPGLSLNATGGILGTIAATAGGAYPFVVTIRDAGGNTVPVSCSIQVTPLVVPIPSISALSPTGVVVGSPAFRLTVSGTNFTSASVFVWNGFDLATTFTDATTVVASIPANLLASAGTAKISVRNTPQVQSNVVDYEVYNALSISSTSPASLTTSTTTTTLTLIGDGFFPELTLSLNGTRSAVTRVSAQQLTTQVPTSFLAQPGNITIRVDNPNGLSATRTVAVVSAVNVTVTFAVDKPVLVTDQSAAILNFTQAPGVPLNGVMDITFVPNADNNPDNGPTDFPRFSTPTSRRITFTVPANALVYRAPIDQGSVSGTATVVLTSLTANGIDVLNGAKFTQTLTVDPVVPLIIPGSVAMVKTATGFNVEVTAISTPRSLTAGTIVFTIASGVTNSGASTFPIDNFVTAANTWFQSAAGKTEGGGFKLVIPFTFDGDFNSLTSVQVTLSNSRGASLSVSGGRR